MDKTLEALVSELRESITDYGEHGESMRNEVLADLLKQTDRIAAALSVMEPPPCPYVVTGREGTSYCRLNGPPPSAVEGMVMVPAEPTEAMKAAGDYSKWNYDDAADIYRAMIAAALRT